MGLTLSGTLSESPIMLAPAITPANAQEMQQRSVLARRRNRELARQQSQPAPEQPAITPVSPLDAKFARALEDTLDQYLAETDATERAKIARSMREVRETYHLYSGAPKPGTIRPERQSSRQQPRQPSEPKLDTTGSGSAI